MQRKRSTTAVVTWIYIGLIMLLVQVLLGGITRLTGSGLSITEWKPLIGTVPPMNEIQWQQAFQKYRQIAQYKYINTHFALSDFKFIFFWEWLHRLWARLIGIAFIIPFVYFLVKKYFRQWMIVPLIILFLLGALQGVIGWLMVKSGLNDTDVYVSHIRLAVHFMAAMALLCYTLVFGLMLSLNTQHKIYSPPLRKGAIAIMLLVCIQLVYGAFMAGLKAATSAPTFPDINGVFIPHFGEGSFLHNLVYNKLAVHFIHRTLAYIIALSIGLWWWKARRITHSAAFNKTKHLPVIIVMLQLSLGILTVLSSRKITSGKFGSFEWLAVVHQLTGMLLMLTLAGVIYLLSGNGRSRV